MKNAPDDQTKSVLKSKCTSAHTQRMQILAHLRLGSNNTFEFRDKGHPSPAPRIRELRLMGFDIFSLREDVKAANGHLHKRVARYFLISEPLAANDLNSGAKS
jgi:hypothetical protein